MFWCLLPAVLVGTFSETVSMCPRLALNSLCSWRWPWPPEFPVPTSGSWEYRACHHTQHELFFSVQVAWLVPRLIQNNIYEGPLSVLLSSLHHVRPKPVSLLVHWNKYLELGSVHKAGCLLGVCSAWDSMINGNIWRNSAFSFSLSLPEEQLWQQKGDWESAFIFSLVWQSQIFLNRIESDSLQPNIQTVLISQPVWHTRTLFYSSSK